MNKCDRMQFRFGDARDWFHGLPCLICRNAIDSFDQSSEGGGTNNLPFVCAAREDVNDAIAHEVSMYGYVGEGTKLVAQTGYSLDFEDSLPEGLEFVAEETELILTDELFKAIDDVHAGSDWTEVIRDSMWESIDQLLEAMPKM